MTLMRDAISKEQNTELINMIVNWRGHAKLSIEYASEKVKLLEEKIKSYGIKGDSAHTLATEYFAKYARKR